MIRQSQMAGCFVLAMGLMGQGKLCAAAQPRPRPAQKFTHDPTGIMKASE
jgi:hypothetical protein